jgi:hypothetical protein
MHPNIPVRAYANRNHYFLRKAIKETKTRQKTSPLRTSQETCARNNVEKVHAFSEHLASFRN